MTADRIPVEVRCQCYPPIRRAVPATGDPRTMKDALLLSCRRRGCRCTPCEVVSAAGKSGSSWARGLRPGSVQQIGSDR